MALSGVSIEPWGSAELPVSHSLIPSVISLCPQWTAVVAAPLSFLAWLLLSWSPRGRHVQVWIWSSLHQNVCPVCCVGAAVLCWAKLPFSSCGLNGNKFFLVIFPPLSSDQPMYQFLLSLRLCCPCPSRMDGASVGGYGNHGKAPHN